MIVPALAGLLGVPLKRALGTSSSPSSSSSSRHDRARGARQHRLGRGAVPGDRVAAGGALGATIALGTKERRSA